MKEMTRIEKRLIMKLEEALFDKDHSMVV